MRWGTATICCRAVRVASWKTQSTRDRFGMTFCASASSRKKPRSCSFAPCRSHPDAVRARRGGPSGASGQGFSAPVPGTSWLQRYRPLFPPKKFPTPPTAGGGFPFSPALGKWCVWGGGSVTNFQDTWTCQGNKSPGWKCTAAQHQKRWTRIWT